MKLSFTSISVPNWTLYKIIRFASETGYDGIELRCDIGHKHGISAGLRGTSKTTPRQIDAALGMLQDREVKICLLGTSAAFSFSDPNERRRNVEEAKEYVILANKLNCGKVRVFGGKLSGNVKKEDAVEYIAESLSEIGHFAEDYGVCPVIEQHDDWTRAEDLATIMEKADERNLGVNWHLREEDIESLPVLREYLKHIHLGRHQSDSFLLDALRVLKTMGYEGYLSFEEYLPFKDNEQKLEEALKEHATRMKRYLSQL